MPQWLTGALAFLGLCYLVVRPLGMDDGVSWVLAVAISVVVGARLRLAYRVTIVERSKTAVTLRSERRSRDGRLSLRQRLGLAAIVAGVAVVTIAGLQYLALRSTPSASAQSSIPPRLHDSQRLPVIGEPSGDSRIEPRLGRAVALVAGLGTEVRCWSVADWQNLRVQWGDWRGQELGPWGAYATRGLFRVHLSPRICASLARLAYEDVPVGKDPWPEELAWSVGALAHEAQHIRGIHDERKAECFGAQSIEAMTEALGRSSEEGRHLARLYWSSTYLMRDASYRSEECRDGGRFDLHPATRDWP